MKQNKDINMKSKYILKSLLLSSCLHVFAADASLEDFDALVLPVNQAVILQEEKTESIVERSLTQEAATPHVATSHFADDASLGTSDTDLALTQEAATPHIVMVENKFNSIISELTPYDREPVRKAFAAIRESDRLSVIEHAQSLFTNTMTGYNKAGIMRAVAAIRESDRLSVIECAQSLWTEGMTGFDKEDIMYAIAAISESDRPSVIEHARSLFTNTMTGSDKATTIHVIRQIPESDRRSVIRYMKLLWTNSIIGSEIMSIIGAIRQTPEPDRLIVTNYTRLLWVNILEPQVQVDIIRAVRQILASNHLSVAEKIRALQINKTIQDDIIRTVQTIANIPAADRPSVIEQAQSLRTNDMGHDGIINFIQAIVKIPAADRPSVMRYAQSLRTNETNQYGIMYVIQAVAEIPAADRQNVIDLAQSFLIDTMDVYNKLAIIRAIHQTTQRNRTIERLSAHDYRLAVIRRAHDDLFHHRPSQDQYFDRVIQLLQTPLGRPFPRLREIRGAAEIVGQEALSRESLAIRRAFHALLENPETALTVISRVPDLDSIAGEHPTGVYDEITQKFQKLLIMIEKKTPSLSRDVRFKIAKALQTLALMRGETDTAGNPVRGHGMNRVRDYQQYTPQDMINMRQALSVAIRLLPGFFNEESKADVSLDQIIENHDLRNHDTFTENWLGETFLKPANFVALVQWLRRYDSQRALLENGASSIGEILGNPESKKLLLALYQDDNPLRPLKMKYIKDSARQALERVFEDVSTLVDTLFTIMRGHNKNGFDDQLERDTPACVDGTYLNLIKHIISFIKSINPDDSVTQNAASIIAGVEVTSCTAGATAGGGGGGGGE